MPSRTTVAATVLALALAVVIPTAGGPASATLSAPATSLPSVATAASSTSDGFASDLAGGTALPPSKGSSGVQEAKAAQDSRAATFRLFSLDFPSIAEAVPLDPYNVSGIVQRALPVGERPYDNLPLTRGIADTSGVRMFLLAGDPTMYNHPVGQASLAMAYLDHYRLTGNSTYLRRALANAQRLVDRRVESRGGWYFPYDFDFAVQGDTSQTLTAPWYSGMAQGMALSAFTRLFQATEDPAWKAAADATFASLNTGPVEGEPFGSWVSATGDLWLELYPRWPVETSERVLNGQIYAAFGVYDYAQLTGSEDAIRLYDGALTTVTSYLMSQFRTPRWASLYSLAHRLPTISYHQKVVLQLLDLQHQTGNATYASWASTLRSDFPVKSSKGFAVITPRTTVLYQLNSARKVVRTKAVRFTRPTGAPVDRRERSYGGAIMLHLSAGGYAGWWVAESFAKARIRGAVDVHTYEPELLATFAPSVNITATAYDAQNLLVGSSSMMFPEWSEAGVAKSAIVDGQLAYYLSTGAFAGSWVKAQPGLLVQ